MLKKSFDTTLITTDISSDASTSTLVNDNSNLHKSLNIIFSSRSRIEYEEMFLLEKIAFIFIEIVIKRGYKTMTNRSFRHLAR